ncbi:ABC transporter ATP-binding protein [Actinoplanes sp. N902-109]|uniref:ABC transporter ATP-binding protein n=1 Tax=Actinoplanes sp. (strain N902-109) TaxID=649831 RepID=UPI000329687A|nr:ABC transporter ATP-binding protein [Actinoplanes sp. N902-109]AGL17260.1 ABC-type spermidine/putrescine transport system, ATPase component [Actinoplanes sp. N902-109]
MSEFQQLRLDGVTRRFGGTDALAGLSLTIRRGEFIALLGPSGCGKSTALNCLAGLLPLSSGSIWRDDVRLDTLPAERRGFGMVFQNYALFPHMSVRGNIAFGLRMRRLPRAEVTRRTDEAIRLVRLAEHAGKLPGQLSGGQQQRVAIARAVVLEPALVLMDEPLSNLDAKLRLEMRTEIRRLHQSLGLTTVYVTHDQEEALSLADRLVVLRDGRVQQIGTPEEVHTQPANRHVADFMGYRNMLPMVFADGFVEGCGLRLRGTAAGELHNGDAVEAAIRPEDIQVLDRAAPGSAGAGAGVEVTVEVVEYQGREVAAEVRTSDGTLLHVRTGQRLAPGDKIRVTFSSSRLLLFPEVDGGGPRAGDGGPRAGDGGPRAGDGGTLEDGGASVVESTPRSEGGAA